MIDYDFVTARKQKKDNLETLFRAAFSHYLSGNWGEAHLKFEEFMAQQTEGGIPEDGPTKVLLEFMGKHHGESPFDWEKHRNVDFKQPSISLGFMDFEDPTDQNEEDNQEDDSLS